MTGENPVLLVEPYLGGSHQAWAEGVIAHSGHVVDLISHPARWWKWRMRGAAVTLAEQCAHLSRAPAAVLVSDMVDVAALRTFARPYIGDVPLGVYFHETQLIYPTSPRSNPDVQFAVTNWTSALAADRVYFNSDFHRRSFFEEVPRLLRHFPDQSHEHLLDVVAAKSQVLEVGVDMSWIQPTAAGHGPVRGRADRDGCGNQSRATTTLPDVAGRLSERSLRLVWNHRWEPDKDPTSFFAALDVLADEALDFEVVVLGESSGAPPDEFTAAAKRYGDRIVHMGWAEVGSYRKWLTSADVVVSTAVQEFFGVAVVEGMAAGCMPVLPGRLSYPDLVPTEFHDSCLYPDGDLVDRLRWAITHPAGARNIGTAIAPTMAQYGWDVMGGRYRAALDELMRSTS
ncbi:DUF3524 domain-containing protein [soil metagenome]